jgi:hypothetical protein
MFLFGALVLVLVGVFPCSALAAPSDASVQAAERLREVAGTNESVTFWSGGTAASPAYTWAFSGQELSREQAASLTSLDLGITVTALDTDGSDGPDTLILDFSHEGPLPAPALVSVAIPEAPGMKADLALFAYDGQRASFTEAQQTVQTQGGYVSFTLTHCSLWALSTLDLATLPSPLQVAAGSVPTPGNVSVADGVSTAGSVPSTGTVPVPGTALEQTASAVPSFILVTASLIALGVVFATCALRYRRRRELAAMQQGWVASKLDFEDIPSLDELMDMEEPREDRSGLRI